MKRIVAKPVKVEEEKTDTIDNDQNKKRFILHNMFFATNQTTILPSSASALEELYQFLNDNPDVRIRIVGHTDDVGSDQANQILSEGRAKSVRTSMIRKGIDPTRMLTAGKGESQPIVPNDNDEHRQMNRRVEIVILNPEACITEIENMQLSK